MKKLTSQYKGLPFTFSNKRQGDLETKARLDRVFSNADWRCLYPRYEVRHVISSTSDHLPLLLDFNKKIGASKRKFFRFEPMWLRHEEFTNIIQKGWNGEGRTGDLLSKLDNCKQLLTSWNTKVFGNVNKQISKLKKEIEAIKSQYRTKELMEKEAELYSQLQEWLAREELFWRQRSRVEWLKEGDKNTKFFHERASQRKRRNTVEKIQVDSGDWISDEVEICNKAVEFFGDIFRQSNVAQIVDWGEAMECINTRINDDVYQQLSAPFSALEIQDAVFQIGPTKAPGLDGFSALFYQKNWDVVKREVIDFVLKFLNDGYLDEVVNESLITLIPKTKSPVHFSDYSPISLINVAMKIITKAMANRLKTSLNQIISVSQSAFIPGRLISDNILLAHELMHHIKTRVFGGVEYCCVKLDMSKAYDRVNWRFLEEIQLKLGFPTFRMLELIPCAKA